MEHSPPPRRPNSAVSNFSNIVPSRRRDCHFDDDPSPCLLKRLMKGEGGAAEWQKSRRRLIAPDLSQAACPVARYRPTSPDASALALAPAAGEASPSTNICTRGGPAQERTVHHPGLKLKIPA